MSEQIICQGSLWNSILKPSGPGVLLFFVLDIVFSTSVWVISLCIFFCCTGLSFFTKLVKKRDWVLESLVSCLYNLA